MIGQQRWRARCVAGSACVAAALAGELAVAGRAGRWLMREAERGREDARGKPPDPGPSGPEPVTLA